jgi:RND family efflux transporter MFP subunit
MYSAPALYKVRIMQQKLKSLKNRIGKPSFGKVQWLIVGVLILGMILVSRYGLPSWLKGGTEQADGKKVSVTVEHVKPANKVPKIQLTGSLEGQTSVLISAKISGRIEQLLVEDGQPVKAGQALVRMESVELANQVRIGSSTVQKAKAAYDNALTDYKRYETLFSQNAVSKQLLDAKATTLAVAEADYGAAVASLSSAREQYGYANVTASVDGVVANRNMSIGQVVAAGQTLMTLEDISSIYAVVNVEQKHIGLLRQGQAAEVAVDAYPGRTFAGTVEVINPVAGSNTRTFRTKIKVPNTGGLLKPGMFAKAGIVTGGETTSLAVPQSALVQSKGLFYVFVLDGEKVKRKQVETGEILGDLIEVKGIEAGSPIISSNVNKLKDGDTVLVVK